MVDGVEISYVKKRTRHQKTIMAENRRNFDLTIQVLRSWRVKHLSGDILHLFDLYHHENEPLTSDNYTSMRDFIICEIINPNAQRAGIIPGLILELIDMAKTQVYNGYHRIMVSEHKTGYLQSAHSFLSSQIFQFIIIFTEFVLPKLPIYLSNNSNLSDSFYVFQTFSGKVLTSSYVTPIVSQYTSEHFFKNNNPIQTKFFR